MTRIASSLMHLQLHASRDLDQKPGSGILFGPLEILEMRCTYLHQNVADALEQVLCSFRASACSCLGDAARSVTLSCADEL